MPVEDQILQIGIYLQIDVYKKNATVLTKRDNNTS